MKNKNTKMFRLRYRRTVGKAERQSAWVPALIGLLGVIAGAFLTQRMNASIEADKTIRGKLEEGYFRTYLIADLATDLNMQAVLPISASNMEQRMGSYNAASRTLHNELAKIIAISDLYEPALGAASKQLTDCSDQFKETAVTHFLVRASAANNSVTTIAKGAPELLRPESLAKAQNALAAKRMECEKIVGHVRDAISRVMRDHL
jgi:hypothetical protein